jgi:hypothetical protein
MKLAVDTFFGLIILQSFLYEGVKDLVCVEICAKEIVTVVL